MKSNIANIFAFALGVLGGMIIVVGGIVFCLSLHWLGMAVALVGITVIWIAVCVGILMKLVKRRWWNE